MGGHRLALGTSTGPIISCREPHGGGGLGYPLRQGVEGGLLVVGQEAMNSEMALQGPSSLEITVVCGGSPAREVGGIPLSCSPPLPPHLAHLRGPPLPCSPESSRPCTSHSSCRLGTTPLDLLSRWAEGGKKCVGAGC